MGSACRAPCYPHGGQVISSVLVASCPAASGALLQCPSSMPRTVKRWQHIFFSRAHRRCERLLFDGLQKHTSTIFSYERKDHYSSLARSQRGNGDLRYFPQK